MNNQEELSTKTATRSKTRIATGIVFAILVAIGIGTAIWYFGVARLGTGTIEFSEAFDNADDLVLRNEGKLVGLTDETTVIDANGNFQNVTEEYNNVELASNENSFSKDLGTESTNYLCSTSLASKIDTIEITPNPQKVTIVDNSVQSSWLRFGIDRLRNAIQISINGKPINPDTGDFDGSSIGDDFVNYNSITWSDLLRWKSSQPKVLLMTANGSIIPVFKGKSTISAGICGIPSNSLEITVDSDLTSDEAVFNNITNAGLGTAKPFFEEKLTNKLILSKELSETHAGANEINISGKSIKGIEGKLWLDRMYYPLAEYRDSIKASDLKLFFSFDKGATWRKVDLVRDINYNFVYNFNQDIFQQTASGLKYALGYEFNTNTGNPNGVPYNKPLENIVSFKGSEDVNFFTIPQSDTIDFKQAQKEDTKINFAENLIKLDTVEVDCSSGGFGTKCYQGAKIKSLNPGISNIQIITPDDPNAVPANTSVSKEMVTLPTSIYLDRLDFTVKTGELGDEPLPEPPGGEVDLGALNVSVDATPTQGLAPMDVKFTATVTGGKGPYKYDWEFAKSDEMYNQEPISEYQLLDSDESSPTFKYKNSGIYSTALAVRDADGNTKYVNGPWIYVSGVKINANPNAGKAPLTVNFSFENLYKDIDLTDVPYTWDFGDGTTLQNEKTPEHIYQNPGEYEVKLTFVHPLANAAPIKVHALSEDQAFCPSNEPDLLKNPQLIYRGADRVVIKWETGKDEYKNRDLDFKYTTDAVINNNGIAVGGSLQKAKTYYEGADNKYYTVLENLQGGEFSEKNDQGYVAGQKPYYFQISLSDKCSDIGDFKTLNRFQSILYYYNLVFGDNFQVNKYIQPDNSLRGGGAKFFYKPTNNQEPLSLRGVHFTLLNDRKFKEFDKRLQATLAKLGTKKAVENLYRRIHDRIYTDNIKKFVDKNGVDYWTKQIERNDNKQIDISGAKFAISVSPEAVGNINKMQPKERKIAEANLAYQIVLKRGGDEAGIEKLVALPNAKEMRKELAMSKEYDDRLKAIKDKEAQIEELYETLYARAADISGVNYWKQSGKSIQEIKNEFLNSAEFTKIAQ